MAEEETGSLKDMVKLLAQPLYEDDYPQNPVVRETGMFRRLSYGLSCSAPKVSDSCSTCRSAFPSRTVPWVYRKMRNGQPWQLCGVDIFTIRDGKIAAKLARVKR